MQELENSLQEKHKMYFISFANLCQISPLSPLISFLVNYVERVSEDNIFKGEITKGQDMFFLSLKEIFYEYNIDQI